MKKTGIVVTILVLVGALLLPWSGAWAATDGFYQLSETTAAWDGTDESRTKAPTPDYNYTYGDESSVTYSLPWVFTFYGQSYGAITADTNGNVWFTAAGSAHSFNLTTTGRGPVIAAWNNDLSSYFYGGVFVQHKTNPERVVVEWQTETYTEQGYYRPNTFEVVIFQNGTVRFDYKSFTTAYGKDFESGISKGDGSTPLNITANYGNVSSLAGRSFVIGVPPIVNVDPHAPLTNGSSATFNGSMTEGATVSATVNTTAVVGTVSYPTATTWSLTVNGLMEGENVLAITATNQSGISTTTQKTVTRDSTPPTVHIIAPTGFIREATPVLRYTVSDGDITVIVDNNTVSKVAGDRLDTLTTGGIHSLRVESRDLAGNIGFAENVFTVDTTLPYPSPLAVDRIGVSHGNGEWDLDSNGNGAWDVGNSAFTFGMPGDIPVTGDWNGDGRKKIGVYRNGQWYLDMNGNGVFDPGVDAIYNFGNPGDVPVTGDWNGDGRTKVGVYKNGEWYLDLNGNGAWDGTPTDGLYSFGGLTEDVPVTGNWTGTGTTKIGVYRNGTWSLDLNGNGTWDGTPTDGLYTYGIGLAGAVPVTGDWTGNGTSKLGVYDNGLWYLDLNGNGVWDGTPTDTMHAFGIGQAGAVPVTADWSGSGTTKIGVFANGAWYVDLSGNGVWNGGDRVSTFGNTGDIPITGDWNGTGTTKSGAYNPTTSAWHLDFNGNGILDGPPTDKLYYFGFTGAIPVTGDWNGTGTTKIGVYDPATSAWYLDYNGNGVWDGPPTDKLYYFGFTGVIPVTGDWSGTGITKIGVYDPTMNTWYLDYNGNGILDATPTDKLYYFGLTGATPITGDWNGSGTSKIGVFTDGTWYLDSDGDGSWDPGTDILYLYSFGASGDKPVTGKW
ncbi:hypothetical protein [Geobacter sp. AOG1]|uniref:hypothetical protein n=1 Tax=Geobacter sp. AOG1 TaxID=1566346 RepID=UPI001CC4894B|nr:hypothetical protein [Geobacter sp. AOG1]GFE56720.1 hypothetical protein AOG1_05990 [Geobacter sp. AOG1]